jgi:hypothetical protein
MNAWKKAATGFALCFAISSQSFASGAIVVNDEEGAGVEDFAIVTQAPSPESATQYALFDCKISGAKSCVVAARFEQCGALAASDLMYRAGTGATAAAAERNAMERCVSCRIVKSACEPTSQTQLASK